MYINHVSISGFWGRMTAETSLHPDVAIFIGTNGTGKTTLINLLVAALKADYQALCSWQFETITIQLKDPDNFENVVSIRVHKIVDPNTPPAFEYRLGSKVYLLARLRHRSTIVYGTDNPSLTEESLPSRDVQELKEHLSLLVNLSWIAVHRYIAPEREEDPSLTRQTAVDARLNHLLDRLAKFQLRIENRSRELSKGFQSSVLELFLYRSDLDTLDKAVAAARESNLVAEETDLVTAIRELGLKVDPERINVHFQKLRTALTAVQHLNQPQRPQKGIAFEDIVSLPILLRTKYILEEMKNVEVARDKIRRPLNAFLRVVEEFMRTKKFVIDSASGELRALIDWKGAQQRVAMKGLSSGEKQLLIQLLEVLLQQGKPAVLIADEPELSLHVSWQEKLLAALRQLNPNAQIIVATHSPDIVGAFRSSVIDMEDIVRAAP